MLTVVVDEAIVAGLRARVDELRDELARRDATIDRLREQLEDREAVIGRLRARVGELQDRLEQAVRVSKRQAAPFSKGEPADKGQRGRPGRKAGDDYGPRSWRAPPPRVDEVVDVALPEGCPDCGGTLREQRVVCQWQTELVTAARFVRFDVHLGRCGDCGGRVQPRHERQTSDALGAAASQLGPQTIALAVVLNKQCGVSTAKISQLYDQLGVAVTASGLTHAIARAADRCEATYQALIGGIRASPVVAADETGWKVDADKAWLWVYVGDGITVYQIADGRGFDQAVDVLGEDYDGILERDGWAPYRKFVDADHQTCLAHLLRRCRSLIDTAYAGQAKTPHAVRRILLEALAVRDARNAGRLTGEQVADRTAALAARVDRLVGGSTSYPPNRRLLDHLVRERDALFTFLTVDGVAATNHRAERAIRPMAVARKNWGGNRTRAGADTHQILASVLTTARQQHVDPAGLLVGLLRDPDPHVATELTIPASTTTRAA